MAENTFQLTVAPGHSSSTTVITPSGALVLENLFKFQNAWRGAQADTLIFDLSRVTYMDSSAIGSLVNAHVSCTNKGRKMALAGTSERVKQILNVTRVDTLFKFYPDVTAAEAALKPAAASA